MSKVTTSKGYGAARKRRSKPSQYAKAYSVGSAQFGYVPKQTSPSPCISESAWKTILEALECERTAYFFPLLAVLRAQREAPKGKPNIITETMRDTGLSTADVANAFNCDEFEAHVLEAVCHRLSSRELLPIIGRLNAHAREVGPTAASARGSDWHSIYTTRVLIENRLSKRKVKSSIHGPMTGGNANG